MIYGLADRAVLLGLVASLAFSAGWKVNGWRLGEGIERERADAVTVVRVIEQQAQSAADTEGERGNAELEDARRAAADARAAAAGLRSEVGRFATRLASCNASTAAERQAREAAAGVLADMLAGMESAGGRMAEIADSARARGATCERTYDGVRKTISQ